MPGYVAMIEIASKTKRPLLVEFTGVTGAGKSTLVTALIDVLSRQGFAAREAHDMLLARYGLRCQRWPGLRAVFIHLLAVLPFLRYMLTREGFRLACFAARVVARDAGSFRLAIRLLRNFVKQIGTYRLLLRLQPRLQGCDFILCDEGGLHVAHNLFVHAGAAPRRDEILLFADIIPKPDVIVWVKAPAAHSIACTLERGHPRVPGTAAAAQAFVDHAQLTFDTLCSLPELRNRTLAVVNSAPNPADLGPAVDKQAHRVAAFLQTRIRGTFSNAPPEEAVLTRALATPA
jgi:hypothetical protein